MKSFQPLEFDLSRCRDELDRFKLLLDSRRELAEREHLKPLFQSCPHLTAFIGALVPEIGPADRIAHEFQVFGDYSADIVIGNSERQAYCAIELEDAQPDSVFRPVGRKATSEWGRRFEHGFSQLVDWFFAWDDHKSSEGFAKQFGYGHVEFYGLLLIGRTAGISEADRTRLRWRSGRVSVNSHKVYCRTYDDLYQSLDKDWRLLSLTTRPSSPQTATREPT